MKAKSGNSAIKNVKANTDWAALKVMPDGKILFTEDAPRTSAADWASAIAHVGLPLLSKKSRLRYASKRKSFNDFAHKVLAGKPEWMRCLRLIRRHSKIEF